MTVRFRLLGPVEVAVDDHPIALGHLQLRCMLTVLLVEANHPVVVDQLIDRVWPEGSLPRQPRRAVQHNIPLLRRMLAAAPGVTLARDGDGYRLTVPPDTVDLHRFHALLAKARTDRADQQAAELLEQALSLWRGEPFADLTIAVDIPWLHTLRTALAARQRTARLDLTEIRLRQGKHADLLAELATDTTHHPFDERLAEQYLLALYRSGRQAEALRHYHHLQHLLAEELGTAPSSPLQQLHQRILAADPTLDVSVPDQVTTSPTPVPRQLPASPWPFTGRTAELNSLDRQAGTAGAVVISAIGGIGGIGKTWLALHWAHRNLDRFPDGQLSVDLRGFGPGDPKHPTDVLAEFLATLGVDHEHQPTDPDARATLYRTRTTGKRLLILLDNAATADQVIPLLPGESSCTVLVTSRNRLAALLTRHGARPVRLDVLTEAEARTVLTTALGDTTAGTLTAGPLTAVAARAVTELVALCGGFPLALGLIAARIRTHPDLLAEIVSELRELGLAALDGEDPDASLPTVLSWSLHRLSDQQCTVFGLLGIAPGPDIALPAASHLTGLSERDTHQVLRALVDASLITHAPGGRYAMHDLVRDYAASTARAHLPEPVRRAALDRVVDFYRHTALAADRLLGPDRLPIPLDPPDPGIRPQPLADVPAAFAWLDTHHPHLLAAQRIAAAHLRHQAAWHLAWALGDFHWRRGYHHDRLAVWQAALVAAAQLPDPTVLIRTHHYLGRAYVGVGAHEPAIEHLQQALTLAERHQDPTQQARAHNGLAFAWERRGDDRRALAHARHALDLAGRLDRPAWAARMRNAVGWYTARLGDYDTARAHCQAALVLLRQHQDIGVADALDSLGYIAHRTGEHARAVDYYRQAVALCREHGSSYEEADTLANLGQAYAALGDHEGARAGWRTALRLYQNQHRADDAERVQRQLDELDRPDADTESHP